MDNLPAGDTPNEGAGSPSSLTAAGASADATFSDQPASDRGLSCRKKTWVGIELLDNQGQPVPGKAYRIDLPDGQVVEGTLDQMGTAGVSGIDPGNCKITFPKLEAGSWKRT
jgi:hypothetical protein